jgi:PAS domain S-box-containing protein
MQTDAGTTHLPAADGGSENNRPARGRRRMRRPSAWTLVVFLVLAVPTATGAAVARRGVQHEADRILSERTAEAIALLSSTMITSNASLSIVGSLAAAQDLRAFEQSAGLLGRMGGAVVGTVAERDGALVVVAAVGGPVAGDQLGGERAALVRRALQLVATVIDDPAGPRTLIAVPVPGAAPMVTYQEGLLSPDRRIPPTPSSPFRELRGAVYAAPTPDPAKLVLTTEEELPMSGRALTVPFDVGADTWTVVVAARGSLVGDFATNAPWILLGVGLLAAALAAAAMELQVRRRAFAQATVEVRTAELEETRHFLERLFASGPTAVLRLNVGAKDNPVVYVSPNTVRILGIDLGEIITTGSFEEWVHPDDLDLVRATSARLAGGALESDSIEYRLRQPDGRYKWVSALWMQDPGEAGPQRRVVVYLNDITERRESEEAIRRAQQASDAANRSKSEFLSRMSHELRTPLNSVLGFGQLLEIGNLAEDQRESVDQIMKAGKHLLGLINEVLDITRIESGRLLLSPEAVPVENLVREALDLIRPLADQREIQLVAHWEGMADRYVYADQQRTKQVLLNLLSNAVKYNRLRGTVAVSCTTHQTRLRVNVADTGPGIRSDQLETAFAPFERLEAAQSDVEGTGIGLTLSRYLTQAMGGTLDAESTIGQGSTFWFELPAAEGPVNRYERLGGADADVLPAPPAAPRRRVLCIEDNPSNLTLVKRVLAMRPEVEVVAAMQGGLGVELASELQPALVLLDLHLPDVAGEQILHRLREDPSTASIPVAILSADATAGQSQRLLAAGALAYMSKPLDVVELLRLVDSAVARQ